MDAFEIEKSFLGKLVRVHQDTHVSDGRFEFALRDNSNLLLSKDHQFVLQSTAIGTLRITDGEISSVKIRSAFSTILPMLLFLIGPLGQTKFKIQGPQNQQHHKTQQCDDRKNTVPLEFKAVSKLFFCVFGSNKSASSSEIENSAANYLVWSQSQLPVADGTWSLKIDESASSIFLLRKTALPDSCTIKNAKITSITIKHSNTLPRLIIEKLHQTDFLIHIVA